MRGLFLLSFRCKVTLSRPGASTASRTGMLVGLQAAKTGLLVTLALLLDLERKEWSLSGDVKEECDEAEDALRWRCM